MLKSLVLMQCASVLVCGLSAGASWAQTTPSVQPVTASAAKPAPSVSGSTSTTATRKVNTGEIYRWVDKQGRVQYGSEDDVPEDRKTTARKIDTRGNIVTSRVPASISSPPAQPAVDEATATPAARQPVTTREKCEAAWQQYRASQECFAQNRQGTTRGAGNRSGGNLSAEALDKCKSLPEPAVCR